MRVSVLLALACLLIAGCSSPDERDDLGDDPQRLSVEASETGAPRPANHTQAVQDQVSFAGHIDPGACVWDGDSHACTSTPTARYLHDRIGSLTGGQLTFSYSSALAQHLHARVIIYEGCPTACKGVDVVGSGELAPGSLPAPSATLDFSVAHYEMVEGQQLGIFVSPILITALASAHPPFDFTIEGELDFLVAPT